MHKINVLVWTAIVVASSTAAGFGYIGAVGGAATLSDTQTTQQNRFKPTYNGAKYEPDNPDCPDPESYSDYSKFRHQCAPPGKPPGWSGNTGHWWNSPHTETKWNSHWWFYGPGAHEPGYKGASWAFRSWPVSENFDMQYYQYVSISAPWGRFGGNSAGSCTVADTQAAGIDYGNNNTNQFHSTASDVGLVSNIKNSGVTATYGYFQFDGPSGAPGAQDDRNQVLNNSDAFVAALGNCWANPKEPGWYRLTVRFNGTTWSGKKVKWKGFNHWQWFCSNCKTRQDAIQKFGPPGTNPDSPWKDTTISKGGGATATPSDSGGGSSGPTATPTASPTPGGGSSGSTATSTASTTPGGGGGNGQSPTPASGPGFGVPAVLVAVTITLVGIARRRR